MTAKAFKLERAFDGAKFLPYLYAAYGMNTSRAGMMGRCPMAEPAGTVLLRNHRLVFRGPADVQWSLGRQCWLALWWFTEDCERALDSLEGYRASAPTRGGYDKRYFRIHGGPLNGRRAMIYVMNAGRTESPPSSFYEDMLRQGYTDFGMPHAQIDRAIVEAKAGESKAKREAREAFLAMRAPKPRDATFTAGDLIDAARAEELEEVAVAASLASAMLARRAAGASACAHERGERSITMNGHYCAKCGDFMPRRL